MLTTLAEAKKAERPSGLSSGLYNLLALVIPTGIYLLTTPFLIHRLGNGQYGVLMILISTTTLLGSMDMGLGAGGILSVGRAMRTGDKRLLAELHSELLTIFAVIGLVFSIALCLGAPWIVSGLGMDKAVEAGRAALLVRVSASALLLAFLASSISVIPRSAERFPEIAIIQVLCKLFLWSGAAAVVMLGHGLLAIVTWVSIMEALELFVYIAWNAKLAPGLRWMPATRLRRLKEIMPYSFFAFFNQLCSAFTYHADKFLVSFFLGPAAVAYYSVATAISSKLLTLAASMTSYVFPRAVNLHGDNTELAILYRRACRFMLLILVPALAPGIVLAPRLLTWWIGPDYGSQAGLLLQIFILGYFASSLSVVPSQVFNGMGNSRIGAIFSGIGGLINIAGCVLLIPRYGIVGAAFASFIGMLQSVVYMGRLEREIGLGWFRSQKRLFASLLIPIFAQLVLLKVSLLVFTWGVSLIATGAAAWLLFYVLWFRTPLANDDERSILNLLLERLPAASEAAL